MNGKAFYDAIDAHPRLEWIDATPNPPEVQIRDTKTDITRAITIPSLLTAEWEDLEAVLLGRKEGRVMLHMTRIVGYFAYLPAWNKSKLAELRDRHKGEYKVPEPKGAVT